MLLTAMVALVLLSGAAPAIGAQDRSRTAFSDAHVHLNDPVAWVRLMDQAGVDRSVALAGRDVGNSMLLEAGRRWPGRILPFISVSPEHRDFRAAWEADDERLAPMVDSLLSRGGYYGIGEISVTHFPAPAFQRRTSIRADARCGAFFNWPGSTTCRS